MRPEIGTQRTRIQRLYIKVIIAVSLHGQSSKAKMSLQKKTVVLPGSWLA